MPTLTASQIFKGTRKIPCGAPVAMPSLSSAAQIFVNPPSDAMWAELSLRAKAITVTYDGTTPTAGAIGETINYGSTWVVEVKDLKTIKGIQEAATATGSIQYWKVGG